MSEREAGRGLDAEVAERVMGWALTAPVDPACDHAVGTRRDGSSARRNFGRAPDAERDDPLPHYSTDIAAAWQVVDAMRERRFAMGLDMEIDASGQPVYSVGFYGSDGFGGVAPELMWEASAATVPLAICNAALATLTPVQPPVSRTPGSPTP